MKKTAFMTLVATLLTTSLFAASADIGVSKVVDDNDGVVPGQNVTFTITVTNNGPDTSGAITMSEATVSELTFVGSSASAGVMCTSASPISCSIPSLTSGAIAAIELTYAVGNITSLVNTVSSVTSAEDSVSTNDSATLPLVRSAASCSLIR